MADVGYMQGRIEDVGLANGEGACFISSRTSSRVVQGRVNESRGVYSSSYCTHQDRIVGREGRFEKGRWVVQETEAGIEAAQLRVAEQFRDRIGYRGFILCEFRDRGVTGIPPFCHHWQVIREAITVKPGPEGGGGGGGGWLKRNLIIHESTSSPYHTGGMNSFVWVHNVHGVEFKPLSTMQ